MPAPRVTFRSKRIFTPTATILIGAAITAFITAMVMLIDDQAWRAAAIVAIAVMLAAFAYTATKYKLVTQLALDGEMLLVWTLFQSVESPALRIPVAETTGWREYVETIKGYSMTTTCNRIVSFRHRGIAYGMAVDHADLTRLSSSITNVSGEPQL